MKWSGYAIAALGLAATIYLILHTGISDVLHLFALAGWGVLVLFPYHVVPLVLDATGWRVLVKPFDRASAAPTWFLVWVASVREAVSRLLPVASIGGDVLGYRLVAQRGIDGPSSAASVAVEIWVNLIGRYLLTTIAVLILVTSSGASETTDAMAAGLFLVLPALFAIALVLARASVFERLTGLVIRLLGRRSFLPDADSAARLDQQTHHLLVDPRTITLAIAWQFSAMLMASIELLIASYLIGRPLGLGEAIALEGLTEGVRFLAFFIPAGLGIQEAGFVFFGQLLGIDAEIALALSLIRRMRELGFGLPMLASWQWHEIKIARARA